MRDTVVGQNISVADFMRSAECFAKAFHASPFVQTVTNFDTGRYLYVNDRFVEAAGYSREEVIGKTSLELGVLADKSDRAWLTQGLRHGRRLTSEKLRFRLRSGDIRMGLLNAQLIQLEGEDCILSTVSDISEQLAAEHRYRLQNTRVAAVDQLAAGLAHAVRNPLAGIKGVADAFLERRKLNRQEREWMEAVRREVLNIDARVRELLDLTQPRVATIEQCSLNELVARVVILTGHQAKSLTERVVIIEFEDATTEPLNMPLDTARIEDAILNLVLNAIESIQHEGRVTVRLSRRERKNIGGDVPGDEAVIQVTDTGCGISYEDQRRIFEPFFTTKGDGTGLGLAAVRKTAAAFNGRISFKTKLGRGSTFELTLPLRKSELYSHES